jgi:FHS family L-fucose permease-like MFS transporter
MTAVESKTSQATRQPLLVGFIVFLFFAWGFATVLNDTLFPKLKGLYSLNYTESMLTQFCFFMSYFVFSVPAGLLLSRIGYIRGVVVGLVGMALGCALFWPASVSDHYVAFLLPLFVIAGGITMLQVAANPFIELLGSEATSHSRLTLAQAFNSLATAIGPTVGAMIILKAGVIVGTSPMPSAALEEASRRIETHAIAVFYLVIALVLTAVAIVFWILRHSEAPRVPGQASFRGVISLLDRPRLVLGAACIFIYVGAEVSIGSLMTNYFMQPAILGVSAQRAGTLVSFYWGGAMVGRFIGAYVLRIAKPGNVLCVCAIGATLLASLSAVSTGGLSAGSLIAVGLCNSIMFPTIFSLASERLGADTPNGSGLLCMAIVGGALVPLLVGEVADLTSLSTALFVPAICYIGIAVYGAAAARGLGLPRAVSVSPIEAPASR